MLPANFLGYLEIVFFIENLHSRFLHFKST